MLKEPKMVTAVINLVDLVKLHGTTFILPGPDFAKCLSCFLLFREVIFFFPLYYIVINDFHFNAIWYLCKIIKFLYENFHCIVFVCDVVCVQACIDKQERILTKQV